MDKFTSPLNRVKVASPCTSDWNKMLGNEQVRYCNQCNLNVYNLSNMTKKAAEDLLRQNENGKLCVRYYRRADGTILTENCPVGLRALKQRISKVATAALAAAIGFFSSIGVYNLMPTDQRSCHSMARRRLLLWDHRTPPPPPPEPVAPIAKVQPQVPAEPEIPQNELDRWATGGLVAIPVSEIPAPLPPVPNQLAELPPRPEFVRRSEGVIRGSAIEMIKPEYPALARSAQIQGDEQIEITIDEAGNVANARVINGHPLLQQTTITAARQWRFKPTLLNNEPIKVKGVLTFRFKL